MCIIADLMDLVQQPDLGLASEWVEYHTTTYLSHIVDAANVCTVLFTEVYHGTFQLASENPRERGLATSAGSQEREELSGLDCEAHVINGYEASEILGKSFYTYFFQILSQLLELIYLSLASDNHPLGSDHPGALA